MQASTRTPASAIDMVCIGTIVIDMRAADSMVFGDEVSSKGRRVLGRLVVSDLSRAC